MQKIGAQYVIKRVTDYVTSPQERPEPEVIEPAPTSVRVEVDNVDGQIINDDQGQPLGRARRVHGVAVYVIAPIYADPVGELKRSLAESETRVFLHTEDNQLTGLIYVPDPENAPEPVEGMRTDDI